jgi:hypothetical protein
LGGGVGWGVKVRGWGRGGLSAGAGAGGGGGAFKAVEVLPNVSQLDASQQTRAPARHSNARADTISSACQAILLTRLVRSEFITAVWVRSADLRGVPQSSLVDTCKGI